MAPGKVEDDDDSDYGSVGDDELLELESGINKRKSSDDKQQEPPPAKKAKSEPEANSAASLIARKVLSKVWRFSAFRLAQEEAVTRLIHGHSAVVVFPTGGGKSLVYQVPALAFDMYDDQRGLPPGGGVSLVISPLIALMKDQVDALKKLGVEAAAMDSSQSREAWLETCNKLKKGVLKLLYVAPERLQNEGFVAMISHTKVRMVAVDEAHCVSQWGHAFRPDYLKVARFVKEVGAERVLCLTATATPLVVHDICSAFGISQEGVFRTTSYRPNLTLRAQAFENQEEKLRALKGFLTRNKGPSIVYVQTHEQTDHVHARLVADGFNARGYHAGMATDLRSNVQDAFMKSKDIIIVATIAFGMGIDKADIRNIIHFAVPKSLEGYSQEIGRAGRDGLPSTCVVYLCEKDIAIMEQWSRADVPSMRSIKGVLSEIFSRHGHVKPGTVIERDLNEESREWDIRKNALDLLNAHLELRFELIRAITPKYSKYQYRKNAVSDIHVISDTAKAAHAIKGASKVAKVHVHVDIDKATQGGIPREQIVRKLQQWHDQGWIELQPSGVVSRFSVLKGLPRSSEEQNRVYTECYDRFDTREKEDMSRVQDVVKFVTHEGCLARELAKHFGDEGSMPTTGCGNCEFCITKEPVRYVEGGGPKAKIEQKKIAAVLTATKIRDDARFLARVAFGISSPRVTKEKLGKHEVFGSMKDCDFEVSFRSLRGTVAASNQRQELVDEFCKACN